MITNKAMYGLLGAGAGTLAVAWFFLPKDSKIKKAISDKVCQLTDLLKKQAGSVVSDTVVKMKPAAVKS